MLKSRTAEITGIPHFESVMGGMDPEISPLFLKTAETLSD